MEQVPRVDEPTICIDCGSERVRAAFLRSPKDSNYTTGIDRPAFWSDSDYVTLRCEDCGSIFLHPHYFAESFAVYSTARYFTGYYVNNIHRGGGPDIASGSFGGLQEAVRARNCMKKARSLLRLAGLDGSSGPRILEIGCAKGRLTHAFAKLGCQAYGLDVSEEAVLAAKGKGINAFCGRLEDYDSPDAFFDLIVAIQTLEHMAGLDEFISKVGRKLKPGGAFVFEVPNDIGGYRARLYRRTWWMIPPMHIRYFTRDSIGSIFGRHGMRVAAIRTSGSFGSDVSAVADWLLRMARLNRMPLYGKFRTVSTSAARILFSPVDWLLNTANAHSELLVVIRSADS